VVTDVAAAVWMEVHHRIDANSSKSPVVGPTGPTTGGVARRCSTGPPHKGTKNQKRLFYVFYLHILRILGCAALDLLPGEMARP